MKTIHIKDKLEQMNVAIDGIIMGDFDYIGEFCAKRTRDSSDPNYKKYGAFFRANYERGILIYYLIRQFNLTSMLEIGFGRGYSTFCAARAFHDAGIDGKITTIDPNLNEDYVKTLQQVLPTDWFKYVNFVKGKSQDSLPKIDGKFDLIYIDGDHSYAATKSDWEMTKNRYEKFVLFDDYHMPSKQDKGTIQCSQLIDEIDDPSKELIILDRRMFFDDRRFTDEQVDYGQVLLTKPGVNHDDW
jgi:predicted O-methyltransferase YrrM